MLIQRKIDNLQTRLSYGLNKGSEDKLRDEMWKLKQQLEKLEE